MSEPRNLARLLGIAAPLIQAPMAGVSTPAMAAAVSNAGGLGSLGAGMMSPGQIRDAIRDTRARTDKPFSLNLFITPRPTVDHAQLTAMDLRLDAYRAELGIPPSDARGPIPRFAPDFDEQFAVVLEEGVSAFSFTFGLLPPDKLAALKARGIPVLGTATCALEAIELKRAGVDAVVAQGAEAGAHRGTFLVPFQNALIGTMALVPQIVDAVQIPVIAAGGIMDARGIRAAFALGAAGVQLGSVFLLSPESAAAPAHKQAVLALSADDTEVTASFSGRPARGIRNRFLREIGAAKEAIPPYPLQNALTRDIREAAARQGKAEYLSLWAGQSAYLAKPRPAFDIAAELLSAVAAVT
jgi:nitronate monooxygenase